VRVYITKYALTDGIYVRHLEPQPGLSTVWDRHVGVYFDKPDWHETRADAEARAEVMRIKKIESLKKQIAKLSSLKIKIDDTEDM
jgi:hypothetical protein